MIKVKMLTICERCEDIAKINDVYIKKGEEVYFAKEYLCDCGHIQICKESINFVIK